MGSVPHFCILKINFSFIVQLFYNLNIFLYSLYFCASLFCTTLFFYHFCQIRPCFCLFIVVFDLTVYVFCIPNSDPLYCLMICVFILILSSSAIIICANTSIFISQYSLFCLSIILYSLYFRT